MPTVSKQTVNGVDYDIKDESARAGVSELETAVGNLGIAVSGLDGDITDIENLINGSAYVQKYVLPDNSDLDNLLDNKVYFVQSGAAHIPAHYPSEFGNYASLIIANRMEAAYQNFGNQIAIQIPSGRAMFRSRTATGWRDWVDMTVRNSTTVENNISSFGGSDDTYSSLADLPENTFFRTYNAPDRPHGQSAMAGFWVLTVKTKGSDLWSQVGFGASTGVVVLRHRASASSSYSEWMPVRHDKTIRILFIGNSYTQDNISYVPFIMKRIAPEINFTIGMTYYSGARIDQYIDFFDNDTRVLMYSKINRYDTAWTTQGINTTTPQEGQVTLKEALADEPWDVVLLQQGSAYMATWSTFSNLNGLVDRVVTYLRGLGLRYVRMGWMMPQMRKPYEYDHADYTFANMIDCVQKVIQTSPLSFVIPCGTAIENARNTSLDSIGAYASSAPDGKGHLCYDTNGHLQEGLPCLCGAYAATLKLLELAGEPYIGVLAENTYPDDTWLSSKAIPIAHGSSTGLSSANCYLAQKCAVAANKFPYEVTTIAE